MPALARDLLLIGRNPVGGRLRNRPALEKGLRAALFVELILAGRIGSVDNCPHALTTEPLDDRILDTVLAHVVERSGVAWWRWYRHVAADRPVLIDELIEDGRWSRSGGYRDHEPDATLALAQSTQRVAELTSQPADRERAVLALLTVMCGALGGRPRPRELRRRAAALLDPVGPASDPVRRSVEAALAGCATAIRRRPRILG